jgi:hypothetical protein
MRVINSGGTMGYVDDIRFICRPGDLQRPGRKAYLLLRATGDINGDMYLLIL